MKRIMLLYGGRSYEHDVSVITAIQAGELWPDRYELWPVYMRDGELYCVRDWRRYRSYTQDTVAGKKCSWRAGGIRVGGRTVKIDCALPVTHGGEGEDGTLQALLRYYNIPYVGCSVATAALTMDKVLCKILLRGLGYTVVDGEEYRPDKMPEWPVIVKPARLGSSLGIAVVKNEQQWNKACAEALAYDDKLLIERFLPGAVEYNCAALATDGGIVVSAIERPAHTGDTYSFGEKYMHECTRQLPADIPPALEQRIRDTTAKLYADLHLGGVVRVDYLWWQDTLYINEINTIPGSLAYRLFSEAGIHFGQLIDLLVDSANPAADCTDYRCGQLLGELVGIWK